MEHRCTWNMLRYQLPGHELKLLENLQKQQNNSQFCDTLLQSDGISIPTHSCILAALSPYLSERLMASPSPPLGQKRHLKFDTVKAQTLLKLVALFYSGEVEVNVGVEQNDLLAAAIKFGIMDLVEGQRRAGVDERCQQRGNTQSFGYSCGGQQAVQDSQVLAEVVERSRSETLATSCPPKGAVGKTASVLNKGEGPAEHMLAQNVDLSVILTHQNLNIEDIRNTSNRSASGDDSEFNCSFSSIVDCTAPCSINVATTSFDRDSNSRLHQGGSEPHQSPALTDMMESDFEDQHGFPVVAQVSGTSAQQPRRAEVPKEERTKSTKKRSLAGRKKLELMKQMAQMVERTQVSIKVKLVRTKGEVWEVAEIQNTETLSVRSSLKQTTMNSDSESSSLNSSPASKPGTPSVHLAATCQLGHDAALMQSGKSRLEDSDVLQGDIMVGLNVPPSAEGSCRNPMQPPSRAQVAEVWQSCGDAHSAAGEGRRVHRHNCPTQVGPCSPNKGMTQSGSLNPLSWQHDAPHCRPPESFVSQRSPTSPTNTQTVESLSGSFVVTPTESVCRELSTQDKEDVMDFSPLAAPNRKQSSPSASLSAVDDLHLPQFSLSPLGPVASVEKPTVLCKGARLGCCRTRLNLDPLGQRLGTENIETPAGTLRQMHTNVKRQRRTKTRVGDDHQTTLADDPGGGVAARRLPRPKEAYVWQMRDGMQTQIQLNPCSVSLSSNNVLAKERELITSFSGKSRATQNVSTDSSKIQTRGFLKKIQDTSSQTTVKESYTPKAAVCVSKAVDSGEVVPIKRKRGRPPSRKGPPKQIVAGASDPVQREQQSDIYKTLGDGGGVKTKGKRRRKTQVAAVPHKRRRSAGKAELGDNREAATKHSSCRRLRKSMVMRVKGNKDKGMNEPGRHEKSSDDKVLEEKDAAEKQDFLMSALDDNSSALEITEGHGGNSCILTGDAVSLLCDEVHGDKLHGNNIQGDDHHGDELQVDDLHCDEHKVDDVHGDDLHGDELQIDHNHGDDLHGVELQIDNVHGDYLHGDELQVDDLYGDDFHGDELQVDDLCGDDLHGDDLHGDDLQVDNLHGGELQVDDLHGDDVQVDDIHGDELQDENLQGDAPQRDDLNSDDLQVDDLQVDDLPVDELNGDDLDGDMLGKEVGLLAAETKEMLQNLGEERQNTVLSSPQRHQVPFNRPGQHEQVDVEGEQQQQEEEEEEEEEEGEIEVVLYTVPQFRVGESILNYVNVLESREEKGDNDDEEDLSEIDVTEDKAE